MKKNQIIPFVRKNTWLGLDGMGWGNGYIAVPPSHPYHGKSYDDVPIMVLGGLTFGDKREVVSFVPDDVKIPKDYWVFGFDTGHSFNNPNDHNEEWLRKYVDELKVEFENAGK